jgi:hypothetical protein
MNYDDVTKQVERFWQNGEEGEARQGRASNHPILQIPNQLFFSALKTRFSASDTELYVGITGTTC